MIDGEPLACFCGLSPSSDFALADIELLLAFQMNGIAFPVPFGSFNRQQKEGDND
jgi:hypothetical protein